ncbi:MAG: hypothetical protein K2X32_10525 [Phycisphaerales bacterium]|nr:hypothetical protein [Phycisphaerales bacterium]
MTTNATNPGSVSIQWHVVAIVDILGQQSSLREWAEFPTSDPEHAKFNLAFRNSIGNIIALRDITNSFLHSARSRQPIPKSEHLTSESKTLYDRFTKSTISSHYFSDSIVLFSPLYVRDTQPVLREVADIIHCIAMMQLVGFAGSVPLRGAIEIGLASDALPGECVGPALVDAHRLAEDDADYPRVIVGPRLGSLLATSQSVYCRSCLDYIRTCADGWPAVDWLKPQPFAEHNLPEAVSARAAALKNIHDSLEQHSADGNEKLQRKYRLLARDCEAPPFIQPNLPASSIAGRSASLRQRPGI